MGQSNLIELLVASTPTAIAVFDTEMHYILASDRWKIDYGIDDEDIIGKSHYEIFPEITQEWKDIHKACLNGAINKTDRAEFPRADGKVDYIKWEVRPWYEDDNNIGGIIMFTEVITEIIEAEIKLEQQIQIQEMMIKNIPDFSVVMFDHDLRILLLGGDTLRKNGRDVDAIQGKLLHEVVTEETYNALLPQYRRTLNGESFFFERRPAHIDQVLHSYANPIKDENGNVIAGLMATQDVTNLEKTRQLLEYIEARFQAIFNNTFQFIGFMNTEGILLEANKTALAFAGLQEDDVIGKPFWETPWWTLSKQTQDQLQDAIKQAAQGEFIRYDVDVVGQNEQVITIDFSIKPIFNSSGEVIQLIPEGRDITDMIKLREELQRSNNELQNFAYIASHDLQEPLRMVTSFLNLLKDEYGEQLSEEADQYINFAVDGAQRMKHLIQDLLSYSRISTQGNKFTALDMNHVIKSSLANLALAIKETNTQIQCEEIFPKIQGDESQLIRLFQNLIGNAIKFQKQGQQPTITIEVNKKLSHWQFAIHDNGIGIDPKFHERIFTIFKRLHNREDYAGTGIGLAVCKKIVQRHHGEMWVESIVGEGSTFYFTLPIINKEASA